MKLHEMAHLLKKLQYLHTSVRENDIRLHWFELFAAIIIIVLGTYMHAYAKPCR